jgi:hypothetical protein
MVKNYKWLGVITLCILLNSPLCAQVLKWDGMPEQIVAQDENLNQVDQQNRRAPFPVFHSSADFELDKHRFREIVTRWNAENPSQKIDEEQMNEMIKNPGQVPIRKSTIANDGRQQVDPFDEHNRMVAEKQKQELELWRNRLLTSSGLAYLIEYENLPALPQDYKNPEQHVVWIDACRQLVHSNPDIIKSIKGDPDSNLPVYPYRKNPRLDPAYPILQNTGNQEADQLQYRKELKSFHEYLNQYQPFQ